MAESESVKKKNRAKRREREIVRKRVKESAKREMNSEKCGTEHKGDGERRGTTAKNTQASQRRGGY